MKKQILLPTILMTIVTFFIVTGFTSKDKAPASEYYQLTTYHCKTAEQVAVTSTYLKDIYLPALHKSGLSNIGVFSAIENDTVVDKRMYVLIPFSSMEKFEKFTQAITAGTLVKNDVGTYADAAFNKPPFEREETVLLKSFKDMLHLKKPELSTPRSERVYELRSYESSTEKLYHQKVKMFNEGGEVKLFDKLHFNAVFFAEVIAGSHMPNLMYMTSFDNKTIRDEHWKNFVADSTWKRISTMPEYLNTVSKADIFFLRATEFSDF